MVPEDLLFWIAPATTEPREGVNVLCLRHADAMSVPRGWTLDDRREEIPRLFAPRRFASDGKQGASGSGRPRAKRRRPHVEQLQIDGTAEIPRPADLPTEGEIISSEDLPPPVEDPAEPWRPAFDNDDNLDGLLEVSSPLLARAFRGTDRSRD